METKHFSDDRSRAKALLLVDVFFLALNIPITFLMFHLSFWLFSNKTILTILLALTLISLGIQTYKGLTSIGNHWKLYKKTKIKDDSSWYDELYEDAKKIAIENRDCSIALLQDKLGIGYARAKNLFDVLEEKGVIGPKRL